MRHWRPAVAGLLAAGLCALSAAADEASTLDPKDWAQRPSDAQLRAAWPAAATDPLLNVDVAIECTPDAAGALTGCKVVEEKPAGLGLGAAALSLAPNFRLKTGGKKPLPASVRVPIDFEFPFDRPPDWLKKPTQEQLLVVWPTEAWRRSQSGKATIECRVSLQGALYACTIASESPAGAHFGEAAIALTPQFLMRPGIYKGQAVVSGVKVLITFRAPERTRAHAMGDIGVGRIVDAAQVWRAAPTYADVVAAYPPKARAAGVGGHVNLACSFAKEGGLRACQVINEEPKGKGFGDAAKTLAKLFQADPTRANGKSISGVRVQLPVTFTTEMLGSKPPTIGKPSWAALPTSEQTSFPTAARKAEVERGRAALSCVVQQRGEVGCKIASEEPANFGFGESALSMAPYFRLNTWTMEGLPVVGGFVRIPLRFELPPKDAAAASAPARP